MSTSINAIIQDHTFTMIFKTSIDLKKNSASLVSSAAINNYPQKKYKKTTITWIALFSAMKVKNASKSVYHALKTVIPVILMCHSKLIITRGHSKVIIIFLNKWVWDKTHSAKSMKIRIYEKPNIDHTWILRHLLETMISCLTCISKTSTDKSKLQTVMSPEMTNFNREAKE